MLLRPTPLRSILMQTLCACAGLKGRNDSNIVVRLRPCQLVFVYPALQSGLVLVVTLKGMNNADQTEVTAVHSVLAERASPTCQDLTLCPFCFAFLCTAAARGEILVRGVRGDEEEEVKEQRGGELRRRNKKGTRGSEREPSGPEAI